MSRPPIANIEWHVADIPSIDHIGRWEERRLLYAGKVQSGFTHEEARAVCERLDALITSKSPLDEPIKKAKATWVTAGPRRGASAAQKREGGEGVRLWVEDLVGLLGLIEVGVGELHPWAATVGH